MQQHAANIGTIVEAYPDKLTAISVGAPEPVDPIASLHEVSQTIACGDALV